MYTKAWNKCEGRTRVLRFEKKLWHLAYIMVLPSDSSWNKYKFQYSFVFVIIEIDSEPHGCYMAFHELACQWESFQCWNQLTAVCNTCSGSGESTVPLSVPHWFYETVSHRKNGKCNNMFLLERQPSENYRLFPIFKSRRRGVKRVYTTARFFQTTRHTKKLDITKDTRNTGKNNRLLCFEN